MNKLKIFLLKKTEIIEDRNFPTEFVVLRSILLNFAEEIDKEIESIKKRNIILDKTDYYIDPENPDASKYEVFFDGKKIEVVGIVRNTLADGIEVD